MVNNINTEVERRFMAAIFFVGGASCPLLTSCFLCLLLLVMERCGNTPCNNEKKQVAICLRCLYKFSVSFYDGDSVPFLHKIYPFLLFSLVGRNTAFHFTVPIV